MLKKEWQSIWKDKKLTLSIIVMFIMPVLYCGMLLWAFWDPYGHLSNLPVAVVNEDEGAEFEGEALLLGNDLIENLLDNGTFEFIEMTKDEAEKSLANQEIYIIIEIPKGFSEHATTLLDENPQKLELQYRADEATNFLSSTIGENAVDHIKSEVNKEIATTYAEQMFNTIATLSDGYGEAASGATEITDGVVELQDGTIELKDYLYSLASSTVTLSDGTSKLKDGIQTATDGSNKLVNGVNQLNENTPKLEEGAKSLAEGAESLHVGIDSYAAGVNEVAENQAILSDNQQQFQKGLADYVKGVAALQTGGEGVKQGANALASNVQNLEQQLSASLSNLPENERAAIQATIENLKATSNEVAIGAGKVAEGAKSLQMSGEQIIKSGEQLASGQNSLQNGLAELTKNNSTITTGIENISAGSDQLATSISQYRLGVEEVAMGAISLNNGLQTLNGGASELQEGTNKLAESSSDLAEGAETLANGTTDLQNGTSELASSLKEANEESKVTTSSANYEMLAEPVTVNKTIDGEVENYGTGFAPYFISLGLFVGALLLTNVYPFVQPAVHPTGIFKWFISKSAVPVIVGFFQVSIISFVLLKWLGLEVENIWLFLLINAVTSFSFLAIVQMFTVIAGDVGRFISLVLLIVQLASSAGTFPIELVPETLQKIHNFMPMTYSVEAYRAVITTTNIDIISHSLIILGTIGIVCVVISYSFFALLYKRRYSKDTGKTV